MEKAKENNYSYKTLSLVIYFFNQIQYNDQILFDLTNHHINGTHFICKVKKIFFFNETQKNT